ncbi:hypothetical protein PV963_36760 [Streptomyces coeruleorubidus]|nr:hypothetical protein [Streptomyces coeruleorubidus]WDV55513.1 hypothetical protein PV963_36760 [Streptomyces coeruleorubidus]
MTNHTPIATRSGEVQRSTGEYKIKPIKKKVRGILGYPYPARIPRGVFVEQWVGISTDEFHRAKDADGKYMRNRHPLIDMDWSRSDCVRYLTSLGLADTPKSSCLRCLMWNRAGLVLQLHFAISAGQRHVLESIRLPWRQVPEVRNLHRDGDGSGSVVRLPGGGAATRTSSARDRFSAGVSVGDGELPGAAGLLPR